METVVLRNKFGDETAIRMLKEAGFDGIDYSFYWPGTPERNMLGEDYISRAREVKSYLKAMDMNCLQAHAPLNPRPVASLELSDLTCLELIRSIEFSGILEVKTLVVHALTPPEGRGLIEYNLEFYRFLEPFARESRSVHSCGEFVRTSSGASGTDDGDSTESEFRAVYRLSGCWTFNVQRHQNRRIFSVLFPVDLSRYCTFRISSWGSVRICIFRRFSMKSNGMSF